MCGADYWPVSESGTENILALDSSSESPRPSLWFFVASKDSSRLRFGPKYSTPSWIFARTEFLALAGVDSLVLVGRKRDRGKTSGGTKN